LISHKVAGAKVVYLSPYSPDLNPIEQVFSKLKTMLRKLKTRTMEALWQRLGELCDVFLPEECKNYFKHAGYKKRKKNSILKFNTLCLYYSTKERCGDQATWQF